MLLADKVVMIVGAGPGLGRCLARRCAEEGADLVLASRTAAILAATADEVRTRGRRALAVPTDISKPGDARALAGRAMAEFGRIDVLVNSAFPGTHRKNVLDMDEEYLELWRRCVEIAAFGTLLACRYVAPHMVAAGRGSIVNVTSMSSRVCYAGRSDYGAGKGAAHKLGQALADELGPSGVRVNAVAPGFIWSDTLREWMEKVAAQEGTNYEEVLARNVHDMALRRIASEDEVASAVIFLASDLASGITGTTIDVNAGQLLQ
jgi:NAD(P)-dependent dehydrogenase (short-subunit alcohol dehydrogenase family)